jgi:sulfite reductase beta subunit-like hemoprotein
LICDPADPLLRVEACPGAPACASALGETRAFARALATALPLHAALTRGATLHVSGCDKGCACSGPASVTVVHAADGCKLGFSVDVAQLTAASGSGQRGASTAELERRLAHWAHTRESQPA